MYVSIEEQERLTDRMCDLKVENVLLREKLRQVEKEQGTKTENLGMRAAQGGTAL